MAFTHKVWKDEPDHSTPITAAALVDLETRLSDYTDASAGSAFAHLTEDAGNAVITTDWGFVAAPNAAAPFDGAYGSLGNNGMLQNVVATPDDLFADIAVVGEAASRFQAHGDGSHHWGDGATAPDLEERRQLDGAVLSLMLGEDGFDGATDPNLALQVSGDIGFYAQNPGTGTYVGIGAEGSVYISNGTGSCTLSTDDSGNLVVNGTAVTVP